MHEKESMPLHNWFAPVILPAVDVSGLKSEPYNKSPFNKTFRCLTMHPLFYMSTIETLLHSQTNKRYSNFQHSPLITSKMVSICTF